jgi:hypothetical protein
VSKHSDSSRNAAVVVAAAVAAADALEACASASASLGGMREEEGHGGVGLNRNQSRVIMSQAVQREGNTSQIENENFPWENFKIFSKGFFYYESHAISETTR